MAYDNALVAGKLRRWEKYLDDFRLPRWEEIPNLGLYMEQVTVLLREYLDYLPPELKDEQFITAATINNYVRIKVMPEPVKRRYYRVHIAYLIIILTLKQSLSIALIQKVIPMGLSEEEVEHIAQELSEAAKLANIEIIGGHTEVTASVTRYVTCAAVIARAGKNGIITPAGMKAGQDIIMTKMAGIEGTAVIASDAAGRTGLTDAELEEARGFMSMVSVVKEGLYAAEHGATAMHDITEGGVFGAAWEMAEASGCGMVLYPEKVLMHPITKKICQKFGIDPYRLISSGSMLIACDDGEGMVKGLAAIGIPAAVIGKAVESGVSTADGTEIPAPEADELYKII